MIRLPEPPPPHAQRERGARRGARTPADAEVITIERAARFALKAGKFGGAWQGETLRTAQPLDLSSGPAEAWREAAARAQRATGVELAGHALLAADCAARLGLSAEGRCWCGRIGTARRARTRARARPGSPKHCAC